MCRCDFILVAQLGLYICEVGVGVSVTDSNLFCWKKPLSLLQSCCMLLGANPLWEKRLKGCVDIRVSSSVLLRDR